MNYELAKELKDAGFRQDGVFFHWTLTKKGLILRYKLTKKQRHQMELLGIDVVAAPTLVELIRECGDNFAGMLHKPAMGDSPASCKVFSKFYLILPEPARCYQSFLNGVVVSRPTPEEAVAKLWLELNKKSVL